MVPSDPVDANTRPSHKIGTVLYLARTFICQLSLDWKQALLILKPATLLCEHRNGFRLLCRFKPHARRGCPHLLPKLVALIPQMATENSL